MSRVRDSPEIEFHYEGSPSETLLAGFSEFGLAGLTAADYLVDQLGLEQTGHISVEEFPAVTPFEDGTPRHHTRLFSRADLPVTVLVGELLVPAWGARRFADAILSWTADHDVDEVVVLSGVPTQHGPDDHRPFFVATEDYQRARLAGVRERLAAADDATDRTGAADTGRGSDAGDAGDTDDTTGSGAVDDAGTDGAAGEDLPALRPMGGGFLDGLNGALMARGVDSPMRVCVFTTPAHAQTPDADAALRLLDAVDTVYDLPFDTAPLEAFAADISRYYEGIAARMQAARDADREAMPEDRMYM